MGTLSPSELKTYKLWFHQKNRSSEMTRAQYRTLTRMDSAEFEWKCRDCSQPTEPAVDSMDEGEQIVEPTVDSMDEEAQIDEPAVESMDEEIIEPGSGDASFEIEQVDFQEDTESIEDSIIDPLPEPCTETLGPVTFHFIDQGSQKGRGRLVESTGFTYAVKERKGNTTYWVCSVRNGTNRCYATVIERDGDYSRGKRDHNHVALPDVYTSSTVAVEVKRRAREDVFAPATTMVEDILTERIDLRQPTPSLPSVACLIRTANRARQLNRPADPKDLQFEIDKTHIPANFLRDDIMVGEFRHLLFYTDAQQKLLQDAKTWYMDATFKIVDAPFTQLFSIHVFVKSGESMKQVPVAFVLMSKRRRRDYKKVFQSIQEKATGSLSLETAVADFEAGMWSGLRGVYPDVAIRGCSFHWGQAVFRKIQSLGLETAYHRQSATRTLLRKILCLPYLPAAHIRPAYEALRRFATTPTLEEFMNYIGDTWMDSSVWPIASWSVFGRAIRTNNDVEGWHNKVNQKATRVNVQLYLLIELLHKQALFVKLAMKLVSERKLTRFRRKTVRAAQTQIMHLWDEYRNNRLGASQLLREFAMLNGL